MSTNSIQYDGYARVWIKGRPRVAHRVAYEVIKGPVPEGLDLDHLCRTRSCVNPDHLEPVTVTENNQRGDLAKLNSEAVKVIRWMAKKKGRSHLARVYGVSQPCVSMLCDGKTWKNVPMVGP